MVFLGSLSVGVSEHKELTSWFEEYINLVGGIERFEELKRSLLVDRLSMVRKFIAMSLFLKITFK